MAVQNILFKDYLRLLTPEEINDLTSSSVASKLISLTDILHYKLSDNEIDIDNPGAKILPFKRDDEEEKIELKAGKNVMDSIDRYYVRENNEMTALDDQGREVELSTFIIKEKERFAYSQSKLKKVEILNLYKKNLKIDLEQEKQIKDDLKKSTQSGILVNKKQA